jgi:CRP/FNR family cyclic AMP-dependent transcriptional regulator
MAAFAHVDKLWYLRRVDLFAGVSDREMQEIADRTTMRNIGRGRVLVRPDEPPEMVYVIKEGRVKVSRYSADGREQILALLEPGDVIGELALVQGSEAVHVEAFEDTLVCGIRREDFLGLIQRQPELMLHVMKVLAERLRAAEEEIADLVFRNVPGRLASLLLRLALAYGRTTPAGQRLDLRLTHHDIGAMIGATRETVTAVFSRLREEGIIAFDQHHIVIRDPDALHRLATRSE